jgi:hypothetical protein
MKLATDLHLMPRLGMVELYHHSSIRLHDVVLNYYAQGQLYLYLTELHVNRSVSILC